MTSQPEGMQNVIAALCNPDELKKYNKTSILLAYGQEICKFKEEFNMSQENINTHRTLIAWVWGDSYCMYSHERGCNSISQLYSRLRIGENAYIQAIPD